MGDVAQWSEHRNSNPKTLGSIPQVNSCADLLVPEHHSCVYRTHQNVWHVKDYYIPYRSVVKEQADGMEPQKHCTKGEKKQGSTVLWLLAFPRESSPNCPALHWDKEVIKSNLI